MPEKSVPAPFGALPGHFLRGPEKSKNCPNFAYFPWWANGPYSPGLGPLLLSTRGGAIGNLSLARSNLTSGSTLATHVLLTGLKIIGNGSGTMLGSPSTLESQLFFSSAPALSTQLLSPSLRAPNVRPTHPPFLKK